MSPRPKLAIFDLDHTLLSGDTDVLWCEFLMDQGVLDRGQFAQRNAQVEQAYLAGSITPQAFTAFYISTLAGRSRAQWAELRAGFMRECILPRIPASARALVEAHRAGGEMLVMSTATNRYLTELTAIEFGIEHLVATEAEEAEGVFTGRPRGLLNMREGKVQRLRDWLATMRLLPTVLESATFYSDSINDLPLLQAVHMPVAVDPDARLAEQARKRGWKVLRLAR